MVATRPSESRTVMLTEQADTIAFEAGRPAGYADIAQNRRGLLSFAITSLVFMYVFCAIGLQGIPGVARSALVCAACLWCSLLEGIRRRQIILERWTWLPVIFFMYCTLTALRAQDMTLELIGKLVTVWGGSLGVGVALRNGVKWTVPIYAMVCAALASVVAHWLGINSIVMWSQGDDLSISYQRASGLMGNPNTLAMACGFPAYFVFLLKDRFNLSVRILCLGLAVYGVILTGSRKGVLLVLCLFVCIGFHQALTRGRTPYVVFCVLAMAILLLLFSGAILDVLLIGTDDILALKRTMMVFHGEGGSYLKRMEMIRISEKLFWQRPLLGHGLGMFSRVSGLGSYAHNNYCELAVGGGILAVFLLYMIHFTVFRYSVYMPSAERVCVWILLANIFFQDAAVVSYLDRLIVLLLIMSLVLVYRPPRVMQVRLTSPMSDDDDPSCGSRRCSIRSAVRPIGGEQ